MRRLLLSLQWNSQLHPQAELPLPPPPQKRVSKELPPAPELKSVARQPLAMLPPEQKKIIMQHRQPPAVKPRCGANPCPPCCSSLSQRMVVIKESPAQEASWASNRPMYEDAEELVEEEVVAGETVEERLRPACCLAAAPACLIRQP